MRSSESDRRVIEALARRPPGVADDFAGVLQPGAAQSLDPSDQPRRIVVRVCKRVLRKVRRKRRGRSGRSSEKS